MKKNIDSGNMSSADIQKTNSQENAVASTKSSTTKYRPKNQNFVRDILIAIIPLFVLYKLSTHPMIASVGYVDPNTPKKASQEEVLANMIKNMALQRYKEKYRKRKQLLEKVEPTKCHDFGFRIKAAEQEIAKSNAEDSNRRAKKKRRPTIKTNNKNRGKKKKMSFSKKKPRISSKSQTTSAPIASSIFSGLMLAFNPSPNRSMKGTETNSGSDPAKLPRKKTKKKKLSFKRS